VRTVDKGSHFPPGAAITSQPITASSYFSLLSLQGNPKIVQKKENIPLKILITGPILRILVS
jgi:hypothetical protein